MRWKIQKPIYLCCNLSFILIFKLTVKSEGKKKKMYFWNVNRVQSLFYLSMQKACLFSLYNSYVTDCPNPVSCLKAWSYYVTELSFYTLFCMGVSRGSVRSTRGLGPTMTTRDQSIGISIGMLPQTMIMSRLDQLLRLGARI